MWLPGREYRAPAQEAYVPRKVASAQPGEYEQNTGTKTWAGNDTRAWEVSGEGLTQDLIKTT
jgi:hypothetical protein